MDDNDLTRGRPTVHRKFDEAAAVLAGDALLALAFEILADVQTHANPTVRADLVLALARTFDPDGLSGGQIIDNYPSARPTRHKLFACYNRKTGALIHFAVEAGSMLGYYSDEERSRLMAFADKLGLVFQIPDDILDDVDDPETVGKAFRKDAASGRNSATVRQDVKGAQDEVSALEQVGSEALRRFELAAMTSRDLARYAVERVR